MKWSFNLVIFCVLFLSVENVLYAECKLSDPPFPKEYGWSFTNWVTQVPLTQSEFSNIYIDLNDKNPLTSALYSVYKSLVTGMANCSGMCILATLIRKEGGHLGYCEPVWYYKGNPSVKTVGSKKFLIDESPADTLLNKTIKIMQAKLLTYEFIEFLADLILDKKKHTDFNYTYDQVEYYLSQGDYPVLIMASASFEAHTIVPYCCENLTGGHKRIWVYDPNRPYVPNKKAVANSTIAYEKYKAWYDSSKNYVDINGLNWTFTMAGGTVWPGNSSLSPLCPLIAVPSSLFKTAYRNPFKYASGAINTLADLVPGGQALSGLFCGLLSSGAVPTQITDGNNHRLFKTETQSQTWANIETDSTKALSNAFVMPFPTGNSNGNARLVIIRGGGNDYNVNLYSESGNYTCRLLGPSTDFKLQSMGTIPGTDKIEIDALATNRQSFKITPTAGAKKYSVKMQIFDSQKNIAKSFEITDMKLNANSPVELAISPSMDGIMLKSETAQVKYNLKIAKIIGGKETSIQKKNISIAPGKWQNQRPSNWDRLKNSKIEINEIDKVKFENAKPKQR